MSSHFKFASSLWRELSLLLRKEVSAVTDGGVCLLFQGKLQVFVHQVTQVRKNIRNGTMDEQKCYLRWF